MNRKPRATAPSRHASSLHAKPRVSPKASLIQAFAVKERVS
jgi:hypothetical protein